MPSKLITYGAVTTIALATIFQLYLRHGVFVVFGLGRTLQPIEDFPYTCRRLKHPYLEACEDLYLDEDGRRLYLGCVGTRHKGAWNAPLNTLNASQRQSGGAYMTVLNIDEPGDDGLFGVQRLSRGDYRGPMGDGSLDMVGIATEDLGGDLLRFYIINNAPPVDENFEYVDPEKAGGANNSVQIFEHVRGEKDMKFEYAIESDVIQTPNRLALTDEGGLVITNDHTAKGGLRNKLEFFTGGGNLVYCSLQNSSCHIAASKGFNLPNGIVRGADGLFYVPNTLSGKVRIMSLQPDKTLEEVDTIHHSMAIDNFSVDRNGDIWAPGFPDSGRFLEHVADPWNVDAPTTVWRFRKGQGGYEVRKMVEDREAKVVSCATTVAHDVKTGRLFMSGVIAPYVVVCDPK